MENEKLPIPVNVVEEEDFVTGFGNKELVITVIALIAGIILAVIIFFSSGNVIYALGVGIFILAITISLIRRDQYNESFIDKLRFMKIYRKTQKQYEYEYHNIYEGASMNGK